MGGVPILLALAAVTVDYGYQPDGKDGVEYIIQVTPEEFEVAKQAGEISSIVDESVRGRVSRFVLRVGNQKLPRDPGPQTGTIAQAHAFETSNDRDPVPIPEMHDDAAGAREPPSMALTMQPTGPITSAKPQDAAGLSMPQSAGTSAADQAQHRSWELSQTADGIANSTNGIANTANGIAKTAQQVNDDAAKAAEAAQAALRRLQPTGTEATNPFRPGATASATTSGAATPFPSTGTGVAPASGTAGTALQTPSTAATSTAATSTAATGRDNQWSNQPSVSKAGPSPAGPSTQPRTASTAGTSALGSYGAPPAGVADPRLTADAVAQTASQLGNPQAAATGASNPTGQTPGSYPAAPQNGSYNYQGAPYNNQGAPYNYQGAGTPGAGTTTATPHTADPRTAGSPQAVPSSGYPTSSYPTSNYPANNYSPNNYPPGGYASTAQLAADYSGADPRGSTGLLPERVATVNRSASSTGLSDPDYADNTATDEEETRGLPQQVFNLLLLLSLIANAYLIIQMSKLIQRYRDLRVNLRAATSGNSPASPAAA